MALTYHLVLAGVVPQMLAEQLRHRFGEVTIRTTARRTVLRGLIADQPAVRALLNLLWDVGSDVRLLRVTVVAARPDAGRLRPEPAPDGGIQPTGDLADLGGR